MFDGKTIELDTMTSNWIAGKKPLENGPGSGYGEKSSYIQEMQTEITSQIIANAMELH
jgi:hypothetical protein